ncbi:hypothetical protein [Acrocarpospora sp. B8E8]|uniref:hypothetical protein n=1 Tax=Acrocarpospora sp. B8E8 TaxID=3153572 RepID=UPI00325F1717
MDPAFVSIVVAVLGGLSGFGGLVYSVRSSRRAARLQDEQKADLAAREARLAAEDGAYKRASSYDIGVQERQQREINRLSRQVELLQRQVALLMRQVVGAGLVPVTIPDSEDREEANGH